LSLRVAQAAAVAVAAVVEQVDSALAPAYL
jgi:hypothetical protein